MFCIHLHYTRIPTTKSTKGHETKGLKDMRERAELAAAAGRRKFATVSLRIPAPQMDFPLTIIYPARIIARDLH